ncbi:type II-A CRISPR-associated protein Csn2 [Actinomyces sp. zg-332]|uniref:type II-A CRISPR-associated protein Csn2 n=1 Tax=Actinomyces sp. zg-332 TaxID=2708340 RepID=UPI00141E9F0E|nr:type II-A CRISPR-associated protein Csn2 [Actinomyces sp. zg-332]QPK94564.1 type II-A CRISPR-associated protein Csn2 [Actinomyces sp. zg-332]
MKRLSYIAFDEPIVFEENVVNILILENPIDYRTFIEEISILAEDGESKVFFSNNFEKENFDKNVEIIYNPYDLDFNSKTITAKIQKDLESLVYDEENYIKSGEILSELEKYLQELVEKIDYEIEFESVNISSVLKAMKPKISIEDMTYLEKVCTYMELINKIFTKSIFIFFNLKTMVSDEELLELYKYCNYNKFSLLVCENTCKEKLEFERITLIDKDMCQIS